MLCISNEQDLKIWPANSEETGKKSRKFEQINNRSLKYFRNDWGVQKNGVPVVAGCAYFAFVSLE